MSADRRPGAESGARETTTDEVATDGTSSAAAPTSGVDGRDATAGNTSKAVTLS
jgi:hypothetical protein